MAKSGVKPSNLFATDLCPGHLTNPSGSRELNYDRSHTPVLLKIITLIPYFFKVIPHHNGEGDPGRH